MRESVEWVQVIDDPELMPPQCVDGLWYPECEHAEPHAHCIVIYRNHVIAAWQYFSIKRVGGTLRANGVYVGELFRRQGLAYKLWEMALRRWRPNRIVVSPISVGGARLIKRLSVDFDYPAWDIGWTEQPEPEL